MRYLSALKYASAVIGNSSWGTRIEAPSFNVPSINFIGSRQQGRTAASSVINCDNDIDSIQAALVTALKTDFKELHKDTSNPYGQGNASKQVIEINKIFFMYTASKKFLQHQKYLTMSLIIAEAGVNHNGDEALAFKLVDAAFAAGADIIKFQTFKAKNVASKTAQKADYQITESCDDESQLELLSRLELPYESHFKLVEYCNQLGIEFLSTAFDSESLNFLVDELDLKRLKIPSGEITNAPFILEHARTGCDLIISTGMATLAEIESVLGVIAFGYIMPADALPSIEAFQNAYLSQKGKASLREQSNFIALHN